MKNSFEIFGGCFSSLAIFKGLTLIANGVVGFFMGGANSVASVLLDLAFLSLFFLPIIIILVIIFTLVLTFSLSYPKNNNYKLWVGVGLAAFIAYAYQNFFLGRIGAMPAWANLLLGIIVVAIGIVVGRILTEKFMKKLPQKITEQ